MNSLLIFISIFFISLISYANNYTRLINTDNPIKINLTSQQETLLEFDFDLFQIGVANDINHNINRQFIDNRLWITALKPFNTSKLLVKDQAQQIRAIFLISATATITPKNYKITEPKKQFTHSNTVLNNQKKQINYVDMTRFLAQKLYAPQRLIKDIGLKRIPINRKPISIFTCGINMTCNGNVLAVPIMQYSNNHQYYAIAIKLINQTNKVLQLDPRDIIGDYLSASFQFNNLQPKGGNGDVSVLYLISRLAHP